MNNQNCSNKLSEYREKKVNYSLIIYNSLIILLFLSVFVNQSYSSSDKPEIFQAVLMDGQPVGQLILGETNVEDVKSLFKKVGLDIGQKRKNTVTFQVGSTKLKPKHLYNPWATMYQLYFNKHNILVLIVDGLAEDYPQTKAEFFKKYPDAHETSRESSWYEIQTPLNACVTLIAVFDTGSTDPGKDKLDSVGLAYTCATK